jgi:hypothetical protein
MEADKAIFLLIECNFPLDIFKKSRDIIVIPIMGIISKEIDNILIDLKLKTMYIKR